MLYLRGILGLVHADVGPPVLEVCQDIRVLPENAVCEDHLVIVVHAPAAEEIVLIFKIDPREIHPVYLVGMDLRFGQHHVLTVGDMRACVLHLKVTGERRSGAGQQIADDAVDLPLIVQQGEGLRSLLPGVASDHHRAQAVDGAEGQLVRVAFPEEADKTGLHIPGGRHGVGHGQYLLRADAYAMEHVSQTCDQHGGLAAPRHSQQQDGALGLTDRLILLPVQLDGILTFKLIVGHGRLLQIFLQSF